MNNTYIIRYNISILDMSENRLIVHPYSKKTDKKKVQEHVGRIGVWLLARTRGLRLLVHS